MTYKAGVLLIILMLSVFSLSAQSSVSALLDSLLIPLVQKGANIGIDIRDVTHDSTLYAINPKSYMTPASVQKLFTTSACLLTLGSDYQYKTPVMYSGKMKGHNVKGDLVIGGSGDPSMSDRYCQGDAISIFEDWTDSLLVRGIHKISGDIIILDTLFKVDSRGSGWNWDDLGYDYAAKRTSFIFRENRGLMAIMGTDDGEAPAIVTDPEMDECLPTKVDCTGKSPEECCALIQNDAVTMENIANSSIEIKPAENGSGLRVTGVMRPKEIDEEYFALPSPQFSSGNMLKSILMMKGIKCKGQVRVVYSIQELKKQKMNTLFKHVSPPLSRIIRLTNKQSVNIAAEALLLKLGRDEENSIKILKNVLLKMDIMPDSIFVADGSGLSRYNLCTAEQLSNLLVAMVDKPEFISFVTSLPIAGKDGSLLKRMKDSPATGRVFAKTGSMRFVRNLSGYALNRSNTLVAFTIMMNDYQNGKEMAAIQDAICILLADSEF